MELPERGTWAAAALTIVQAMCGLALVLLVLVIFTIAGAVSLVALFLAPIVIQVRRVWQRARFDPKATLQQWRDEWEQGRRG